MRHVKSHDHSPNDVTSVQQATVPKSSTGIYTKIEARSYSRTRCGFYCWSSSTSSHVRSNLRSSYTTKFENIFQEPRNNRPADNI